MKLLELFSGTGSVGRVFEERGWQVTSLDINPKSKATITSDIRTWNYKDFNEGHFDAVWASPCCTQYSCARRGARTPRDLEGADSLVLATLEIINYLKPKSWFIENPQTGMLKDRTFMQGLPFTDLDYCRYCKWGYRKRTRLWTNTNFKGRLCLGKGGCENMTGTRHNSTAQQGKNATANGYYGGVFKQGELYRIPNDLCVELCGVCV